MLILSLDLKLSDNGTWTVHSPGGHYRACNSLEELPKTISLVIEDYAKFIIHKAEIDPKLSRWAEAPIRREPVPHESHEQKLKD